MRKPRRGDIVEVRWLDSERISLGWRTTAAYLRAVGEPGRYRTAGYWLGKRGGCVALVLSVSYSNKVVAECMAIPRVAVTSTRVLRRGRKRDRKALKP